MGELTTLIRRAHSGDDAARNAVFEQLYQPLQKLARARLARSGRHNVLDTASLVNEAFLRLSQAGKLEVEDRARYLAYASKVMRSVVVDFVRARLAARRGGVAVHVTLNTEIAESIAAGEQDVLQVHNALEELSRVDERAAQVVEMRYFGGLTEAEVATALGLSDRTVRRAWEKARLLLSVALASQRD